MKKHLWKISLVLIASGSVVGAVQKKSAPQQCYEFTSSEKTTIQKLQIQFPLNSKKWRRVTFRVFPVGAAMDEGIAQCDFTSDIAFRCVRDDGGGELEATLKDPAKLDVAYWYIGEEGSENPLELPKAFTGKKITCPKK